MGKSYVNVLLAMDMAAVLLSGCAKSAATEDVDYNSKGWDVVVVDAREEGKVNSVGIPDTWANWIGTWQGINDECGIAREDLDMSPPEETALFKEKGKDGTKDIGDVGQQQGPVARSEGAALKYKTSYWDDIPSWAKDDDGGWIVCYVDTISIITNNALADKTPQSFQDILGGGYKVTIDNVFAASQAQRTTLATAYAMGGDTDNLQPAYDFWSTLAKGGRIDTGDTSTTRIESGEIVVGLFRGYNASSYRDNAVSNNPSASFTVYTPSDGSIQSGYTSTINMNAPNPNTACLAREHILSNQGQINLAIGYATPIRNNVVIPAEVQAKRIDQSQYASAHTIEDSDK